MNDEVRKERLVDMYYFTDPRDLIKNRVTEQMDKLMQSPAGKEGVGKKESRASRGSEHRSFRERSQKKNKSKKENKSDWMYRKGGHVGGKGESAERSRKEDGVCGEEGEE